VDENRWAAGGDACGDVCIPVPSGAPGLLYNAADAMTCDVPVQRTPAGKKKNMITARARTTGCSIRYLPAYCRFGLDNHTATTTNRTRHRARFCRTITFQPRRLQHTTVGIRRRLVTMLQNCRRFC